MDLKKSAETKYQNKGYYQRITEDDNGYRPVVTSLSRDFVYVGEASTRNKAIAKLFDITQKLVW